MKLWKRKVARAFIFDPETNLYLIVKHLFFSSVYSLAGGGIHKDESPELALRRELAEELNIKDENIISIKFLYKTDYTTMWIPHTADIFLVTVKDLDIKQSFEIQKIKWVNKDQLKEYLGKDVPSTL